MKKRMDERDLVFFQFPICIIAGIAVAAVSEHVPMASILEREVSTFSAGFLAYAVSQFLQTSKRRHTDPLSCAPMGAWCTFSVLLSMWILGEGILTVKEVTVSLLPVFMSQSTIRSRYDEK